MQSYGMLRTPYFPLKMYTFRAKKWSEVCLRAFMQQREPFESSMTSNDGMELRALEMRLHQHVIKTWVLGQDMDGRLKNHHSIKVVHGSRPILNTYMRNAYMLLYISVIV